MPETANRRQQLEEARLRHQLELQSQQIERVFDHHQLTARVAGGNVQQRAISFDLQTLATGWERLRELKQDLMTTLGTSSVQISREDGSWRLQVVRPEAPPVGLLDLLSLLEADLPTLAPTTAVLGLAENGQPLLLNFNDPHVAHVLVSGQEQAGKTVLLRSLALSLALLNKQSQLQMLVIDTAEKREEGETAVSLDPLNYLPHLLQDVVQTVADADALLAFLVEEMGYRQNNTVTKPVIVVLIDNVVTLLRAGSSEQGQSVRDSLLRLAQRGAAVGIHLVLATRRPEARELDDLRRLDLAVRLVGRVHDAQEAVVATGMPGTQAEYLLGKGDFLAVVSSQPVHFQAAFVGDYDFHLSLRQLHAQQPCLLAQPYTLRMSLPPAVLLPEPEETQPFSLDSVGEVSFVPMAGADTMPTVEKAAHEPAQPDPLLPLDLSPLPAVVRRTNGRLQPPPLEPTPTIVEPLQPEPEVTEDELLPLLPIAPEPTPTIVEPPQPEPEVAEDELLPLLPVAPRRANGRLQPTPPEPMAVFVEPPKPEPAAIEDDVLPLLPLGVRKTYGRSSPANGLKPKDIDEDLAELLQLPAEKPNGRLPTQPKQVMLDPLNEADGLLPLPSEPINGRLQPRPKPTRKGAMSK